ncbi:helix-turn-helix domain-containing protein [Bacillus sp. FSL K6-3431]|uniref:helix-turn-helix domain-containing protein n=1 Tax=Bacillus sp. FSL K6-3431 TaxID=2921500 RepID=UPI0030F6BAEC
MIGSRIRQIRTEKGLTLAELSKRTGIVQTYLRIIERNLQSNPTEEYIVKIATALDVGLEYLLNGTNITFEEKNQSIAHFISLRKCIVQMNDKQLEEMKDFIEYTMWKRQRLRQGP